MKQRGIIMRDWEVRAIREGRKTQKRFIIKPQPRVIHAIYNDASIETNLLFRRGDQRIHCPYGQTGDRLWVKETHAKVHPGMLQSLDPDPDSPLWETVYRADANGGYVESLLRCTKWRSSALMPRRFSRITLEIVSVRAQRLLDITEEDAIAEGCSPETRADGTLFRGPIHPVKGTHKVFPCAKAAYRDIWESIHGPGSWERNDFVFAVEFKEAKP